MAELVTDCPRCAARNITFAVVAELKITPNGWQQQYEVFCICGHCRHSTIFHLRQREINEEAILRKGLTSIPGTLNRFLNVVGYVSTKDAYSIQPPEHLPPDVLAAFKEGAKCLAIGCYNAAGTMFRLCIDLGTRKMLPEDDTDGLNNKIRRNLGFRMPWLFKTGRLPEALCELSTCVKEDGNDGAHEGTLTEDDSRDLLDFTTALLERIYTEPERLKLAQERRVARRQ